MIGQTISHFEILEKLGEGGMGVVYKARDVKLDRLVALKFLPEQLTADGEAKGRFVREAKAASALDHPNICTIFEIDELPSGQLFMAMGYYEGQSLEERLQSGPLDLESAVAVIAQVASGLAAAHRKGIVHRDVKPANVLLSKDGQVRILDFGVAKLAGATRLTMAGSALGTLAYMSPEQVEGKDPDSRSDIFSLGVMLYEVLTGTRPFHAEIEAGIMYSIVHEDPEPLATHNPDLPGSLQELLDSMLAKEREDRLATLDEFGARVGVVGAVTPAIQATGQAAPTSRPSGGVKPGDEIGPYRLRDRIGVGGMGEVWAADQEKPIRRRVALKIIKLGMDSKEVVARFEAERQALALMNHPNVAKVFDAGTTPTGRPYFAMEYVSGVPITEYCDRHTLGVRDRLELLQQVCEGVQHAHQKAIIHRDLKPSNVLVCEEGGKLVPKIIDFGVAKATSQRLTEQTMYTQLGVMIGTPEYMSPEQANLTGEEIDTRTDVYSLGVILYELLVGALPFDPTELREAGFDGIRKMISEKEPPRPSTRISTLGERSTDSARVRSVSVDRLGHQLKGDLDWITMKALEKDRRRRYLTPIDLSRDIDRHLRNLPVEARPPTLGYRVSRYVRRNRIGVTFAGVLGATLIGTGIALAVLYSRALDAEEAAATEAKTANEALDFMVGLFRGSDPFSRQGQPLSARDLLDKGAAGLEQLDNQPEAQIRLMSTIGDVYRELGAYPEGIGILESALRLQLERTGPDNLEVSELQYLLSYAHVLAENYDEAEKLGLAALATRRELAGDRSRPVAQTLMLMSFCKVRAREYPEAEKYAREALDAAKEAAPKEFDLAATIRHNLGWSLFGQGHIADAKREFEESLRLREEAQGYENPATGWTLNLFGWMLVEQDDPDEIREGIARLEEAIALNRRLFDSAHVEIAYCHANAAIGLMKLGDHDKGEQYFRYALEMGRRFVSEVGFIARVSRRLTQHLIEQKRYADAETVLLDHFARLEQLEDVEPQLREAADLVSTLYTEWGRPDKYETWRKRHPAL